MVENYKKRITLIKITTRLRCSHSCPHFWKVNRSLNDRCNDRPLFPFQSKIESNRIIERPCIRYSYRRLIALRSRLTAIRSEETRPNAIPIYYSWLTSILYPPPLPLSFFDLTSLSLIRFHSFNPSSSSLGSIDRHM